MHAAAEPLASSLDGVDKSTANDTVREPEPGIAIREWDPRTPYLKALKTAQPNAAFSTYLAQRKKYGTSPAFYLDCAEFFRKQKQDKLGHPGPLEHRRARARKCRFAPRLGLPASANRPARSGVRSV